MIECELKGTVYARHKWVTVADYDGEPNRVQRPVRLKQWWCKQDPIASLFTTQKSKSFSANTLCQLLIEIYRNCGIVGATSHSGRRTFITNLAAKGGGVRVLAELAAHASISTTQRYIDVNDSQLRMAIEQLD